MSIKRTCRKLHLWIGLATGIIVFIVSMTGALCLFKDEICTITRPWKRVTPQNESFLEVSQLVKIANKAEGNTNPSAITMGRKDESIWIDYFSEKDKSTIYLNPYNGNVLYQERKSENGFDFFQFLMDGHLRLWLPMEIGKPLVSYGVLLFFLTLLTGLAIWLPKRFNKKSLKSRLTFHHSLKPRRFIFDLHSVLGFYMLLPMITVSLTGLIFGLDWFSQGIYKIVSGGNTMEAYTIPASDSTNVGKSPASINLLQDKILKEFPHAIQYYYSLPSDSLAPYRVSVVHEEGSYYKQDNLFFDQYSLKELKGSGPYAGRYQDGTFADKLIHASLDIHEGIILGFFGKLIMFMASLTAASLPITGYLLWRKSSRR